MAEKVTRQFADTDTGTPISGGLFRLVNVTDPTDLPREMIEGTDPEYPGRYSTQAGEDLAPGIWRVERNSGAGYVWTGEEITVSPARVFVGDIDKDNAALTQAQFVLADCVKATAFVPEETALGTPLLPYLQDAVNYAALKGIKRVEVGVWKGRVVWSGSSQLDLSGVPGLHLDLKGAEIYRFHGGPSGGDTPIKSVGAHFSNGKIAGTGNDNPLVLADDGSGYFKSFFTNVEFGSHTGVTVNDNGWGVTFSNCLGHRLPAVPTVDQYQGTQSSDSPCMDENDVVIWPAGLANVDGNTIGQFFRHGTLDAAIAPTDTTSPFADGRQMAEALKSLWFEAKPRVDALHSGAGIVARTFVDLPVGSDVRICPLVYSQQLGSGASVGFGNAYLPKAGDGKYQFSGVTLASTAMPAAVANFRQGLVIEKIAPGGDAKFKEVVLEGAFIVQPPTIAARSGENVVAWSLGLIRIPAATIEPLLLDKNGTDLLIPPAFGVEPESTFEPLGIGGWIDVSAVFADGQVTAESLTEVSLSCACGIYKSVLEATHYYIRIGKTAHTDWQPSEALSRQTEFAMDTSRWFRGNGGAGGGGGGAAIRFKARWGNHRNSTYLGVY